MSDWITWTGTQCPVKVSQKVDLKFRDGLSIYNSLAGSWVSKHNNYWDTSKRSDADIVSYRRSQDGRKVDDQAN